MPRLNCLSFACLLTSIFLPAPFLLSLPHSISWPHRYVLQLTVASSTACYWLGGFFSPRSFLTAVAQDYCRATGLKIDQLTVRLQVPLPPSASAVQAEKQGMPPSANVVSATPGRTSSAAAHPPSPQPAPRASRARRTRVSLPPDREAGEEWSSRDSAQTVASSADAGRASVALVTSGPTVWVSGLHLQGAAWTDKLSEVQRARQPPALLPPVQVVVTKGEPKDSSSSAADVFVCPVFRTARRADDGAGGFVAPLALPAGDEGAAHWTARGVTVVLEPSDLLI